MIHSLSSDNLNLVFYDGECGLCHRFVLFLLRHDPTGSHFIFAPLSGKTFIERISPEKRSSLPDSIVILTRDGKILIRSAAVAFSLEQIGGWWQRGATLLKLLPRVVADWGYDRVAAIRKTLFQKPAESCPLVPPELRTRFLTE